MTVVLVLLSHLQRWPSVLKVRWWNCACWLLHPISWSIGGNESWLTHMPILVDTSLIMRCLASLRGCTAPVQLSPQRYGRYLLWRCFFHRRCTDFSSLLQFMLFVRNLWPARDLLFICSNLSIGLSEEELQISMLSILLTTLLTAARARDYP
jgi:hypothetical protein